MDQPSTSTEKPCLKYPCFVGGILSYLVPGLGQIYQGRVAKGLLFMVCLLGMFIGGQTLGAIPPVAAEDKDKKDEDSKASGWRIVYIPTTARKDDTFPRNFLPRILLNVIERWHYAGQFWIGVAAWPAIWQFYDMPLPDAEAHPFWHNFQRGPRNPNDDRAFNTYLTNHDKMPELAWVYTVVAGMLNILVIYDAFAGPAHGNGEGEKGRKGEGENG